MAEEAQNTGGAVTAPSMVKNGFLQPFGLVGPKEFPMSRELLRSSLVQEIQPGRMVPCVEGMDTISCPHPSVDESKARYRNGTFDATFALRGYMPDFTLKKVLNAGRSWGTAWDQTIGTRPSLTNWGASRVSVAPAFAGLASTIVDTGVTSSWANLLSTLGESSVAVNKHLLDHVRSRHNCETNPVRFVMRLAIMYVMAKTLEDRGSELRLKKCDWPDVREISATAHISALLDDTRAGYGCIYLGGSYDSSLDQRSLSILTTAAAQKVRWDTTSPHSLSKFWPAMPPMVFAYTDIPRVSNIPQFDAFSIWSTAVTWCGRYATVDLLRECVEFCVRTSFSPNSASVITLSNVALVGLPEAKMEGYALGPIMGNLNEADPADFVEPSMAALVGELLPTAMLIGLLHQHSLWHSVLSAFEFNDLTPDEAVTMFRRYSYGSKGVAHSCQIQSGLNALDSKITGSLGRLLSGFVPSLVVKPEFTGDGITSKSLSAIGFFKKVFKNLHDSLQWEEILVTGLSVPEESSIWGTLFPLAIEPGSYQVTGWGLPERIGGQRTFAECCHSVDTISAYSRLHNINWSLITETPSSERARIPAVVRYINRTNRMADYTFRRYLNKNGISYSPIFQVLEQETVTRLTQKDFWGYHLRWFVDVVDLTATGGGPGWNPDYRTDYIPEPIEEYDGESDGSADDASVIESESTTVRVIMPPRPGAFKDAPPQTEEGLPISFTAQDVWLQQIDELLGEPVASLTHLMRELKDVKAQKYMTMTDTKDDEHFTWIRTFSLTVLQELGGLNIATLLKPVTPGSRSKAAKLLGRMAGMALEAVHGAPDVVRDVEIVMQACKNMSAVMDVLPALDAAELRTMVGPEKWDKFQRNGIIPNDEEIVKSAMVGIPAGNLLQDAKVRSAVLRRVATRWREELFADVRSMNPRLGEYSVDVQEEMADDSTAAVAADEAAEAVEDFLEEPLLNIPKSPPQPPLRLSPVVEDVSSEGEAPPPPKPVRPRGKQPWVVPPLAGRPGTGTAAPTAESSGARSPIPDITTAGMPEASTSGGGARSPMGSPTVPESRQKSPPPKPSRRKKSGGKQSATEPPSSTSGEQPPTGSSSNLGEFGDVQVMGVSFVQP